MVDVQRLKIKLKELVDVVDDIQSLLQAFLILTAANAVDSIETGRNDSTLVN